MDDDTVQIIGSLIIFLLIIIAYPLWMLIGGSIHYSSGDRIGYVVKWSERGFFIKNWCGEISVGGQGQAGYVFDFGINRNDENNQALIDKFNSLQGQKVEITYNQRGASNPFNGCNDYLVTSVKAVK